MRATRSSSEEAPPPRRRSGRWSRRRPPAWWSHASPTFPNPRRRARDGRPSTRLGRVRRRQTADGEYEDGTDADGDRVDAHAGVDLGPTRQHARPQCAEGDGDSDGADGADDDRPARASASLVHPTVLGVEQVHARAVHDLVRVAGAGRSSDRHPAGDGDQEGEQPELRPSLHRVAIRGQTWTWTIAAGTIAPLPINPAARAPWEMLMSDRVSEYDHSRR